MRVYLDDERQAPDGWVHVRWPDEAIALLAKGGVTEVSLDHDLGNDDRGTGYAVILWIEEAVALRGFKPPKLTVHSANSSARMKMERGIESIERLSRHAISSLPARGRAQSALTRKGERLCSRLSRIVRQ